MKLKVLTSLAGDNFNFPPGVHEVPEEIADDLVKSGLAEPVEDESAQAKKRTAKKKAVSNESEAT